MPESSEDKNGAKGPRAQLYWFVNKLLSISEKPVEYYGYGEVIYFPVDLLRKEETGLFPLGRYAHAVGYASEDQEYAGYCEEMLEKIKRDIYKLENKYSHFNEEKFTWGKSEDGHNFFDVVIDYYHRPLFEAYLRFMDNDNTGLNNFDNEKYSEADEAIFLETLGIIIKGNYILRGKEKVKINSTDKALIYYLFYKSIKNGDECFTIKDLSTAEEIRKSEKYIENRIIKINQSIKKIISKEINARIPRFILKEKKRGYHLNPKIIHIKLKK